VGKYLDATELNACGITFGSLIVSKCGNSHNGFEIHPRPSGKPYTLTHKIPPHQPHAAFCALYSAVAFSSCLLKYHSMAPKSHIPLSRVLFFGCAPVGGRIFQASRWHHSLFHTFMSTTQQRQCQESSYNTSSSPQVSLYYNS
jgi:hypothetical protein